MGLFSRKKQKQQQGNTSKYSINMKDKKTRKYFEEQFGSLANKNDAIINVFAEMQWVKIRDRIDSIPVKKRNRMIQIMIKHKDKLTSDVRSNLERYVNEKWGVKVGE
jgi:hypothetical protein